MTASDPGLFRPESVAWRVNREVAVLAGGTCALLMQLAHPAVAAGVAQHSRFQANPFSRLRRTLDASYAVAFGSGTAATRAIARVNAIHERVAGQVPETGAAYRARDPRLLLWVHATLVDTALRAYTTFVAPLSEAEEEAYHADLRGVALRMGIPDATLPASLRALRAEMERFVTSGEVAVSTTARALAPSVLYPTRFLPRVVWDVANLASLSLLPEPIRRGYGIRWSAARQRGMQRLAALSRAVLPAVPSQLRFAPQARAARRRLARAV